MELTLNGVKKSYNKKTFAVKDFTMTFTPGVYGLLGPNGAGKSTLMNMITDNLAPTAGEILFDGEPIAKLGSKYREKLGYMPQQQNLYDDFTGEQFLWYIAALKGLKKKEAARQIEEALGIVNLKGDRHQKLKAYSGGMKQRILIAQALLNSPQVLVMDEPTAGLDPKERIRIRNFISEIAKDKIVLLATHVVPDVEYIAKEILLMEHGEILRDKTPEALLLEMAHKVYEVSVTPEEQAAYEREQWKIANVMLHADGVCLRIVSDTEPPYGQIREVQANLEDVYLYLIG